MAMKTLKMVPVNKGTLVTFRSRWGLLQQREQKGIGVLVDWRCSVPWWRHGRYVNNPKLLLSFKPYELTCNNVGICSASTLQGRNKRHGSWWTLTVVFHQFLCGMMQARSSMEWYSQHIPLGGSSISLSLVACNFVIYIDWSFLYYSPNLRIFFFEPFGFARSRLPKTPILHTSTLQLLLLSGMPSKLHGWSFWESKKVSGTRLELMGI